MTDEKEEREARRAKLEALKEDIQKHWDAECDLLGRGDELELDHDTTDRDDDDPTAALNASIEDALQELDDEEGEDGTN